MLIKVKDQETTHNDLIIGRMSLLKNESVSVIYSCQDGSRVVVQCDTHTNNRFNKNSHFSRRKYNDMLSMTGKSK